jgi:SAM-dependent methyltransferase
MSRVSSLADFGLGGGSLSENRLYTQYDPAAPYLVQRAAAIRGRFANLSTKILIAGCGPGALVKMLSDLGYTDVWGCDFSTELINYGRSLYPALSSRLLVANCLSNSGNQLPSMTGVRRAAGLTGGNRFALCITDDLLTVMSDAEVATCLTVLRATASTLLHVLWPVDPTAISQDPSLNWKTVPAGWQTAIGGGEWVIDARTSVVYGANGVPV